MTTKTLTTRARNLDLFINEFFVKKRPLMVLYVKWEGSLSFLNNKNEKEKNVNVKSTTTTSLSYPTKCAVTWEYLLLPPPKCKFFRSLAQIEKAHFQEISSQTLTYKNILYVPGNV